MINIPFSVKIIAKPVLVLVLLITVSIAGFSRAFYEVGSLREESAATTKSENILKSKLDTLSLNEASVATDTNYAVSFFPGENPALSVLYQLRASAVKSGLLFSNFKVGSEMKDASGFMTVSISFDVEGPLAQILDFVGSLKAISPNVWINKTDLNFAGDSLKAGISSKSYWSSFPAKIPALTEPITSLDNSEKETLARVSSLSQPSFVTLTSGVPRENLNPFGE